MNTVPHVDLPRFMGSWYVIGNIPTLSEKDAYGAIESYNSLQMAPSTPPSRFGKAASMARRRHDIRAVSCATGFECAMGNAVHVAYQGGLPHRVAGRRLQPDHRRAAEADYVWIMARTPAIPDADYRKHVESAKNLGYDVSKIRKVPQR